VLWAAIVLFFVLVGVDVYRAMGVSCFDSIIYRVWLRNSRYSRVRLGMTENQVMSMLGRPDRTLPNPHYETWYYGLLPGYRLKMYRAFVDFDPSGRVTDAIRGPGYPRDPGWPHGRPAPGMTKQQVLRMVGKPDRVELPHSTYVVFWTYRLWNKGTWVILFDRRGRVSRT
jgi:outer membrane protein assembly factor BamE (lipoprotein component of BamABCDE complex)